MRDYECAVIFAPTLSTEALAEATKRYADLISAHGGSVTAVNEWGKRGLAYEIKFHREGYYCFYRFQAGREVLAELSRQLRIDENVLRHMIVKDELKGRPIAGPSDETSETEDEQPADTGEEV